MLEQINSKKVFLVGIVVILGVGVLALQNTVLEKNPDDLKNPKEGKINETVEVGYVAGPLVSPLFTAYEEGFFRERGLKLDMNEMAGPDMASAMAGGSIDVGVSATTVGVQMAKKDLPLKLVARLSGYNEEVNGRYLMVREGLEINSIEDFKGKTVCSEALGSMDDLLMKIWMEKNGFEPGQNITYTTTGENTYKAAFSAKSVDACLVSDPFKTSLEQENIAYVYSPMNWSNPAYATGFLAFTDQFTEERPKTAERFMEAYKEGANYAKKNQETRLGYISEYTQINLSLVEEMDRPQLADDLKVSNELMENVENTMLEYGLIEKQVDVSSIIDNSYLEKVNQ